MPTPRPEESNQQKSPESVLTGGAATGAVAVGDARITGADAIGAVADGDAATGADAIGAVSDGNPATGADGIGAVADGEAATGAAATGAVADGETAIGAVAVGETATGAETTGAAAVGEAATGAAADGEDATGAVAAGLPPPASSLFVFTFLPSSLMVVLGVESCKNLFFTLRPCLNIFGPPSTSTSAHTKAGTMVARTTKGQQRKAKENFIVLLERGLLSR